MDKPQVVPLNLTGDSEAAQHIREIADMVESGAIRDIVIAYDNREQCHFAQWGVWRDKWHILGALEYAKAQICD